MARTGIAPEFLRLCRNFPILADWRVSYPALASVTCGPFLITRPNPSPQLLLKQWPAAEPPSFGALAKQPVAAERNSPVF